MMHLMPHSNLNSRYVKIDFKWHFTNISHGQRGLAAYWPWDPRVEHTLATKLLPPLPTLSKFCFYQTIGKTWGFPSGSDNEESACNAGDLGLIPGSERFPGEENDNLFQFLAWRIPWTEELGKLQSVGLQRDGHDWELTLTHIGRTWN